MEQENEIVIEPSRPLALNFLELWHYRELFYFFAWRDIKVKYKQTVLGVLWVVLQPVLTVIIFSFFFGHALKVPSEGIDYPVFVFSGLLLWNIFSSGVSNAGNSMVNNAQIIKKIYFPRLIIPVAALLVSLFDFLVSFFVFALMLGVYGTDVDFVKALLFWPPAILTMVIGTLGLSCWLAALNVKYRDFRYIIPFFIQALLFLTPVIYPISIVHNAWMNRILSLNPIYGPITLFRMPFLPGSIDWQMVEWSIASSCLIGIIGIFYFRKTEGFFADLA